MKYISRASAIAATAALAAPAFAHAGEHSSYAIIETIAHWVAQPSHGLPLLFAAAAIVGTVIYTRRQRG